MIQEITKFFNNNIQKEIKCNENMNEVESIFVHSFQHVIQINTMIMSIIGQRSAVYNIIGNFSVCYKDRVGNVPTSCISVTVDRFLALKNLNIIQNNIDNYDIS